MRYLLLAKRWTGSSTPVFHEGGVKVSTGPDEMALSSMVTPCCLVRPGASQSDPVHGEEPDLLHASVGVRVIAIRPGDAVGENPLIGGNRTGGQTSSKGRGILELEEEVFAAIEQLGDVDGVRVIGRAVGESDNVLVEDQPGGNVKYIAWRDHDFTIACTADRYYHAPRNLAVAQGGAGQASVTWALPPDRYDRYKIILRRAAGSTAPSSPSSGTGVTLASNLATSVTDACGVGTFSWAVFCAYDETHPTVANEERYSEQERGTTKTATIA